MGERLDVRKTYKLYIGGKFPRSESGRSYLVADAKGKAWANTCRGSPRKDVRDAALDHNHTYASYKKFLLRTLQGVRRVLKQHGVAAIVIGDVADPGKHPRPLAVQIWNDMGTDTGLELLELVEDHLPVQYKVSRIWGETKGQATARDCALVLRRDDGSPDVSQEAIDWDEPYGRRRTGRSACATQGTAGRFLGTEDSVETNRILGIVPASVWSIYRPRATPVSRLLRLALAGA